LHPPPAPTWRVSVAQVGRDEGHAAWGYINVAGIPDRGADPLLEHALRSPAQATSQGAGKKRNPPSVSSSRRSTAPATPCRPAVISSSWTATPASGLDRLREERFRHNATCAGGGRLYTVDRLSGEQLGRYKRDDQEPPFPPRLIAFDLQTGKNSEHRQASIRHLAQLFRKA